ncbi:MAG: acylphosphatase [Deltaproteobacteria bacterium]|nr:MAG: acylphosphatase [Deltaproteobacteria bacterium]
MMAVRAHLLIRGRVQGVWYRGSMENEAERLGVAGWVRNRPDGAVEAEVEGEREAVEALIAWARHGPPAARVTDVEVRWTEPRGERGRFVVR